MDKVKIFKKLYDDAKDVRSFVPISVNEVESTISIEKAERELLRNEKIFIRLNKLLFVDLSGETLDLTLYAKMNGKVNPREVLKEILEEGNKYVCSLSLQDRCAFELLRSKKQLFFKIKTLPFDIIKKHPGLETQPNRCFEQGLRDFLLAFTPSSDETRLLMRLYQCLSEKNVFNAVNNKLREIDCKKLTAAIQKQLINPLKLLLIQKHKKEIGADEFVRKVMDFLNGYLPATAETRYIQFYSSLLLQSSELIVKSVHNYFSTHKQDAQNKTVVDLLRKPVIKLIEKYNELVEESKDAQAFAMKKNI